MRRDLVLGIDFGTDSVRAAVVDARDGRLLGAGVHAYARWARGLHCDPKASRFRQHPLDYLEGLRASVRKALRACPPGSAARVAGLAVDTTGSTPCAADRHGRPLALDPAFADDPDAMFILWKDHCAVAEAAEINQHSRHWGGQDYTVYAGGTYSSEWFWAKLLRVLRHNPRVREAAHTWIEHCDWIPALLTGVDDAGAVARGRCAAGHKALWHPSWGGLPSEEFLSGLDPLLAGLRGRLYSETVTAETRVGGLCAEWARQLGLPEGLAVAAGAFDVHMGVVAAGIRPGWLVKVMGTSTCDIAIAPPASLGARAVQGICGQVEGSVYGGVVGLEAGQSAVGDAYAWFANLLAFGAPAARRGGSQALAAARRALLPELERRAAALPPEAGAPVALDWLNGRRTPDADQSVQGAFSGLDLGTDAPRLYRSLVEATAFGARRIVERLRQQGVPVERVVALGGVAKRSPLALQIHADVLGLPVAVLKEEQACALGAAHFAACAAGLHPDIPSAQAAMQSPVEAEVRPQAATVAVYDGLYARYQALAGFVDGPFTPRPRPPADPWKELRREAYEANLQLPRLGLVLYTFGNASALDRRRGLMAIKPSGVPYEDLRPEDLVVLDLDGRVVDGRRRASSDSPTHLVLYRRVPALGGVVHTHAPAATAWAQACRDLPLLGSTHADHLPVDVPCAPPMAPADVAADYEARTGEHLLRDLARRGLDPAQTPMVLLANHGPYTWGATAAQAVYHARVLEELARMALDTLRLNPQPAPLSAALIDRHYHRKHGAGAYYGQPKETDHA